MKNIFFDIHAHLFNENYVLREVFSEKFANILEKANSNFKETSELSYTDLISKYKKTGISEADIKLMVLTYDLDYVFQTEYGNPSLKHNFKFDLKHAKNKKEEIYFNQCNLVLKKKNNYHYPDFLKENECLKDKYPDTIYLFYYFDPRRSKSLDFVKKNVRKKGESVNAKKYIGVKIYPQNGYSPLDPEMHKLYEYCQQEEIPITLHFSNEGFSSFANTLEVKGDIMINGIMKKVTEKEIYEHTFKHQMIFDNGHINLLKRKKVIKERAEVLNHPFLWHIVMEKYQDLRINFAHFGSGSKERTSWVLKFIKDYPNAYTDLSCAKKGEIKRFLKKVKNTELENKILFGSDYALNELFTSKLRYIYSKLHKVFKEKYNKITFENSKTFLRFDENTDKVAKKLA